MCSLFIFCFKIVPYFTNVTLNLSILNFKTIHYCPISPSSTGENAEIVRPDIMIEIRTPAPPLCVCEFTMALPFLLSTKKKTTHYFVKAIPRWSSL